MTSTNWIDKAAKIWGRRAELEAALQASSLQHIRSGMESERRRVDAEDQLALKAMGGSMEAAEVPGDVIFDESVKHIHQPDTSQFAKLAGAALLAAAIMGPVALVAWKYLDRPQASDTDTRTQLRIFRPDGE